MKRINVNGRLTDYNEELYAKLYEETLDALVETISTITGLRAESFQMHPSGSDFFEIIFLVPEDRVESFCTMIDWTMFAQASIMEG